VPNLVQNAIIADTYPTGVLRALELSDARRKWVVRQRPDRRDDPRHVLPVDSLVSSRRAEAFHSIR
jgi:hypothetical protein